MHGEPLTILVDHRERAPTIESRLRHLGATVERRDLPVADYIVAERFGVERKTVADLHRSIVERRLWVQVASLRRDCRRACLIVEGRLLDAGTVSRVGIRSALLAVGELGVQVLRTEDPVDTARWLWVLARRNQVGDPRTVRRSIPRRHPPPVAMLSSVPGVTPAIARVLLDTFGSVAGVAAARPADLMSIEGIGQARAGALLTALSTS